MADTLEHILRAEKCPQLNFRNMLSAHTTNQKDSPLWPKGNLQACFCAVPVNGQIEGRLTIPNSFMAGDKPEHESKGKR